MSPEISICDAIAWLMPCATSGCEWIPNLGTDARHKMIGGLQLVSDHHCEPGSRFVKTFGIAAQNKSEMRAQCHAAISTASTPASPRDPNPLRYSHRHVGGRDHVTRRKAADRVDGTTAATATVNGHNGFIPVHNDHLKRNHSGDLPFTATKSATGTAVSRSPGTVISTALPTDLWAEQCPCSNGPRVEERLRC